MTTAGRPARLYCPVAIIALLPLGQPDAVSGLAPRDRVETEISMKSVEVESGSGLPQGIVLQGACPAHAFRKDQAHGEASRADVFGHAGKALLEVPVNQAESGP